MKTDLVFRGQRKNWSLIPKIGRYDWNGDIFKLEQLMMEEFNRVTPRVAEFAMDDDWDRLAVAQHHGLPTRLIDWTYSAAAALWFAVKDGPSKNDQNRPIESVVWALKTMTTDFRNLPPNPFAITETQLFRPRVIAHRIQAQSGLFTVHASVMHEGAKRFIPLERNSAVADRLISIPINAERFTHVRKELDILGVNDSTMFPNLDGICKHLTWRYTKAVRPEAMVPPKGGFFSMIASEHSVPTEVPQSEQSKG